MFVIGLVLSLAIGLSLGLLGGGGSTLTVPVLHYVFGIEPHDAIAMSLVVVGVTSGIAMIPHARAGRVNWRVGLAFGASSMASAYVGGHIGGRLPPTTLMMAFALLMLVSGAVLLWRAYRPAPVVRREPGSALRIMMIGVVVGLVTGILGSGGGFMIVPALTLVGGLAIRDAVGTSLLVITLNTMTGLAGNVSHSHIDGRLTLAVVAVAVTGSFFGARVGRHLSTQVLQRAFAGFVVALGFFIFMKQMF